MLLDTSNLKRIPSMDADCFACGTENQSGLGMAFYTDGYKLYAEVVPPSHLRGWRNVLHGGISATILDEIMAWSAIHLLQRFILTKSVQVDFVKPIYIKRPLLVEGWVEELLSDRSARMRGCIKDASGEEAARAVGEYALFQAGSKAFKRIVPDVDEEALAKRF